MKLLVYSAYFLLCLLEGRTDLRMILFMFSLLPGIAGAGILASAYFKGKLLRPELTLLSGILLCIPFAYRLYLHELSDSSITVSLWTFSQNTYLLLLCALCTLDAFTRSRNKYFDETEYLLSSPANAHRLRESIKEIERGGGIQRDTEEWY